jgi:antitoxin ParD1/3/4
MAISLSPETQRMIEEGMKQRGYASADDLVRAGLALLNRQAATGDFEPGELDGLIAQAEAEFERGEGIAADEVFAEIRQMSRDFRKSRPDPAPKATS